MRDRKPANPALARTPKRAKKPHACGQGELRMLRVQGARRPSVGVKSPDRVHTSQIAVSGYLPSARRSDRNGLDACHNAVSG